MDVADRDIWAEWVLRRRHGGSETRLNEMLAALSPVRERLLTRSALSAESTLLDLGCGDGYIGFGALRANLARRVLFVDISQPLLDEVRQIAGQMGVADNCVCLHESAEALQSVGDASVDAVVGRSVLIYVTGKQQAFAECHRVLRRGRWLSIFEPINRFTFPEPPNRLWGVEVTPVTLLAASVKQLYRDLQPPESDPMMNFDERDLLAWAEAAVFREVNVELQLQVKPWSHPMNWTEFLHSAANPRIPTPEEAMRQALSPADAETLKRHLRPLIESGNGIDRLACAYLAARK